HDFEDEYAAGIIPDFIAGVDTGLSAAVVANMPDLFDDAAFDAFSRGTQGHWRVQRRFLFLFWQMKTCIQRVRTDQEMMIFPLRAYFDHKGCIIHLLNFVDLAFFQY